ncbi:hypothetical protein TCAL_11700 [Tigriopus californicus]|uniref:Uncharacterized protein n=1 Tax=Tigriopus californicus TaxID=6832 RepID=A0A553PN47_TIGCA|nr:hypothetical protein TCAL_11700 [Tigriopus californicus]|eukprot:TCALIF_11700-PA protein Name:"Protein of unknown function" AED:0.00 eAED:0.00 QI:0/1/0.5/1/0/0/2/243/34
MAGEGNSPQLPSPPPPLLEDQSELLPNLMTQTVR